MCDENIPLCIQVETRTYFDIFGFDLDSDLWSPKNRKVLA